MEKTSDVAAYQKCPKGVWEELCEKKQGKDKGTATSSADIEKFRFWK